MFFLEYSEEGFHKHTKFYRDQKMEIKILLPKRSS